MNTTFLTSQQMQDLISVDRSTVYRMAEDGRLPGVKVGRQWRFPADRVAAQLGLSSAVGAMSAQRGGEREALGGDPDDLGPMALLRRDDAQSIVDLIGESFGTMAVITDLEGNPITEVANPCGYYDAVADRPNAVAACLSEWRMFAEEPHVSPRWMRTHLGFLCARTFVWVDLKPVGMIVVGGVTPPDWPPPPEFVEVIADELEVSPQLLLDSVADTWDLDLADQRRVIRMLPQFGDLVSQLVTACGRAVDRHDPVLTDRRGAHGVDHPAQQPVPQGGDRP
jgi:excisionase family DNA binding protein